MSTDLAYVTPRLVTWAIKRSGLQYSTIEEKLKVNLSEINKWEKGKSYPTFSKAIDLADLLRVPFGYFFLSEPPETDIPLPDLRTLTGHPPRLSPNVLEVLYGALTKQEWYREYAREQGAKKLRFVSSMDQELGVNAVAAKIRTTLSINRELREVAHDWDKYLSLLVAQAELAGILVMRSGLVGNDTRRKLSPDEFQGFSITDDFAPLIFINGQDFKRAQIFTLAHELAHLWIGESGICYSAEAPVGKGGQNVETFCDAVAAEILVPKAEFIAEWNIHPNELPINKLARVFWVSTFVILRRAYETQKITRIQFHDLLKRESAKRSGVKRGGGGGDYYGPVINRHSSKLTKAVIRDVYQGGTLIRDGARLLDLKPQTFAKLMERT
jgi:Zn-dependent peptidase ImmA (M78 family)/transcriptional regulator with XRE-family HTH domain